MKISVGQQAPDLKLINTEKQLISLEDYLGKVVVLFFFPMAWSGTCTKEMCIVQENYSWYKNLGVEIIGISVDTVFALKHFADDNKLYDLTLLSDFNKEAITAYDVVIHDYAFGYHGVAKRATFVIDKKGFIQHIDITPTPADFPNIDEIKAAVKLLV